MGMGAWNREALTTEIGSSYHAYGSPSGITLWMSLTCIFGVLKTYIENKNVLYKWKTVS